MYFVIKGDCVVNIDNSDEFQKLIGKADDEANYSDEIRLLAEGESFGEISLVY